MALCHLYNDVHLLLLPYAALNSKFYCSAVCKKLFSSHPTFQIVSEEVFPSIMMTVQRLLPSPRCIYRWPFNDVQEEEAS